MKKQDFEKLLYEEWKSKILDIYIEYCELPQFDQLKDLADCGEFYSLFYPLGISSHDLTDIALVCSDIHYAVEDDGDLSIIVAKNVLFNRRSQKENPFKDHPSSKLFDFWEKLKNRKVTTTDFFVMRGHRHDITFDEVAKYALYHSPKEDKLESYEIRRFNYEALNLLHSFVPRFNEQKQIGRKMDNDLTETFPRKRLIKYHDFKEETDRLIEEAILSLP